MGKAINVREIKRQYDTLGPARAIQHLTEALEQKHLRPDDFSIRDLAIGLIPHGSEWIDALSSKKGGFVSLQEAVVAVDTTAFSNITGQIVYNKILEGYENPDFLWQNLCETIPTTFLNGERIAGIGGIGDMAELVDEAAPYPMVGVNQEFVDTPPTERRGFIVPVTKDIIIADRTGLLLKRCSDGGHWLGVNKEKRVLDCATGQTNTYKRNGVSTNTYLTSGAYINSHSNTLVDHTDIENSELILDAITDPNTGEPIMHQPDTILVPSALKKTAMRAVNATEVAVVDNQANAGTIRQWSPVPGPFYGGKYKILSNAFVKQRTSSSSTWFLGNFKKAFRYMQVWAITTATAGAGSEMEFTNDIAMRFKVSERGVPAVENPRFVVKST